jgi:aspartyl-tRNA(Asn)/glutamyl-tRNA(Gln) amidotransferase subunit A
MDTLASIAKDLANGVTDPVSLVETALERAHFVEHAFIAVFDDAALTEALAATERWRTGCPLGPLDGIPIAIKDLLDVRGSRTTAGSLTRAEAAPAEVDAPVIAALRAQGLIILGKTNLSEFAFSGLGLNPHFGTPTANFIVAERRVPGGSSSGSAIAVQRGIVAAAIGTDTAGSIRVPAALNGLVGFKGSVARYNLGGVQPLAPTLDGLGPIARTIGDCVWLDAIMRGLTRSAIQPTALQNLRFVLDDGILGDQDIFSPLFAAICSISWSGCARVAPMSNGDPPIRLLRCALTRLEAARSMDADQVSRIRRKRHALIAAITRELDGAILVLPTVKHVAPALAKLEADAALFAQVNIATLANTMIGSLLDMPGLAIPSATGEAGLPTSALFALPCGEDDLVLGAGLAIETILIESQH